MVAIHQALGLSNALLLLRDQRDRDSQNFNLAMLAVFYLGLAAFVAHALFITDRDKRWLWGKLLLLAAYWTACTFLLV